MSSIAEAIIGRKFGVVVVSILLGIIVLLVPISINYIMGEAISKRIEPLEISILKVDIAIQNLRTMEIDKIKGAGIAGYKKFEPYVTKEDLFAKMNSSFQSAEAIRVALKYPESKILLVQLNPQKTLLFESFFSGDLSQ